MNSASSSGTFGDEKDHVSTEYIDSSPKYSQGNANETDESIHDIEAIAEERRLPIKADNQGTSNNNGSNNLVHPVPPDGGLQAWSQAVCGHLVSL